MVFSPMGHPRFFTLMPPWFQSQETLCLILWSMPTETNTYRECFDRPAAAAAAYQTHPTNRHTHPVMSDLVFFKLINELIRTIWEMPWCHIFTLSYICSHVIYFVVCETQSSCHVLSNWGYDLFWSPHHCILFENGFILLWCIIKTWYRQGRLPLYGLFI